MGEALTLSRTQHIIFRPGAMGAFRLGGDVVHLVVIPALDHQAEARALAVIDLDLHERRHADHIHVLR